MTVPPRGRTTRAGGSRRSASWRRTLELRELSMGMSDDFEVAVEEGATMVRVGRALFGPATGARPDVRRQAATVGSRTARRQTHMASMWRRAMVYLGLQDDDELDYGGEYEPYGDYADPADEPQPGAERRDDDGDEPGAERPRRDRPGASAATPARCGPPATTAPDPDPAVGARTARDEPPGMSAPRPRVVRTIGPTTAARVHVIEPTGFNDAQEVGDRLKANQPVILNLQGLPKELQRRLIDFSSGLAYAVGGTMQQVADQVFLLTPTNVEVSQEEKERLQARGLFQA